MTCYSNAFILVRTWGPWQTKCHIYWKRAYFGTSTAVPYFIHIVHGVRYRPYSYDTYHRYILRILVSLIPAAFHGHTLTGMRVPVLQNEDSSYSRLYVRECNTSNTGTTPITRMFALLLPWILLVLEALQSHTGILALVRRRALSLETHVSVLAWGSHERV